MQLKIEFIDIAPTTLNLAIRHASRGGGIRSYKSDGYKLLESKINATMMKYHDKIEAFNDFYEIKKHYLSCQYRFYYPIFTKKGMISKTSKDASNIVKPFEDCIFKWLAADDSQVVDLNVTKIHSEKIRTVVEIHIKNIENIK